MVISHRQISSLQQQLESVTGQPFKRKVVQNDDRELLISWQNDTHVDYLLHVMALDYHTFQVAFAVQKYRDIETRYDHRLERPELDRLFNDARRCVRYMTGQVWDSQVENP